MKRSDLWSSIRISANAAIYFLVILLLYEKISSEIFLSIIPMVLAAIAFFLAIFLAQLLLQGSVEPTKE